MALVEHLASTDLEFVFKGGTSLLLHLPSIKRLSIDIDIMTGASESKVDRTVRQIAARPPFIRVEEDERGTRGLPKRRHFKFYYLSPTVEKELFILLDVVHEADSRLECVKKRIETEFLEFEGEDSFVITPTTDALLGDKLTAFAPKTLGVPFYTRNGNSHSLQVMKQLFDVGELFASLDNPDDVRKAYQECYRLESTYSERSYELEEVLNDTEQTAKQICMYGVKGVKSDVDQELISNCVNGTQRLRNHLVRRTFTMEREAKIAAARVVYLSRFIKGDIAFEKEKFPFDILEHREVVQNMNIFEPAYVNRLKQTVPEAFYCLALALAD